MDAGSVQSGLHRSRIHGAVQCPGGRAQPSADITCLILV
jgi:hypothetical protein